MQINLTDLYGSQIIAHLNEIPNTCPICHRAIVVHPISPGYWSAASKRGQVVFRCVANDCQNLFIATYNQKPGPVQPPGQQRHVGGLPTYHLILDIVEPMRPQPIPIPEKVSEISPAFVAIRNQVADAEARGLDQITGIGFRKALEFLIKDFAMLKHPNEKEQIKKMFLGPCIDTYIHDGNMKACAKRAGWLGNDETHYIRKWETKDVQDLKKLIQLTVNWMDSLHQTETFVGDMPEGKG
jgi:hypothetical protein